MSQSISGRQNELIVKNGTRRRSYNKSTSGCLNCKLRKVKCDEGKPSCGNCKKHYKNPSCCRYDSVPGRRGSQQSRTSSISESSELRLQSPVSIKPSGSRDGDRILELRLLHHYTKSTCHATTLREMVPIFRHPMWEIDIPQIAFTSDLVLDALFAISALHLHFLTPNDQTLARASKLYFEKAIRKQRLAVAEINSESAEPLLLAATLIAHHTWLASHAYDPKKVSYRIDLQTFQMCRGIQALVANAKPLLSKYEWLQFQSEISQTTELSNSAFIASALEDMSLVSESFATDEIPIKDRETYEETTKDLVKTYHILATGSIEMYLMEQRVVTFLHRLPVHFISLLERQEPIAMALLARNNALLFYLETSSAWWLHGAGDHKVYFKGVLGIHGLMPSDWLWSMEWPLKVITKQIRLDHNWSGQRILEVNPGDESSPTVS